jgi:cytochrome c peroxidase
VCNIAERGFGTTRQNIDRGWVLASRLSRVPLKEEGPREAIALDVRGAAVGDPDGVAVAPDGQSIAIAAGGSQELLLLRLPLPFVASGGPGDLMDVDLRRDGKRFRRVAVEGRPVAAAFTPDGKSVVVANYLRNAVQVVDVEKGEVVRAIELGGPEKPSVARRGEAIFYDAKRSFGNWYSCHSCHTDGHTNGGSFDTANDGKYGNLKKVASLRGVAKTAPYTWHGWQPDLRAGLEHSLVQTMQGPKPSAEDLDALMAYVATLDFVAPKPPADEEAVKRGAAVFKAKRCAECHAPPDYTTAKTVEVGLESKDDAYKGFNPPSLRGVGTRGPWLHDGRAKSLEQVFRKHHLPSKLTGEEDPTDAELRDLIEFLKSL